MGLYKKKYSKIWWMSYTVDGKQMQESTSTSNKNLADRILSKRKVDIAEGKFFEIDEGSKRTFSELVQRYEERVFHELKSWKTAQSYLNQLNDFFGEYTLSEIKPSLIDDFKQMRKSQKVKPATINRQLGILKRLLNLAKNRWQWIRIVPHIEMEPKADNKRVRFLSFDDYHKLLNQCDEWLRDIVVVAAWTGLRQGNILNLRSNQVNLTVKTITIEGGEMKNGRKLVIPLSRPALSVLETRLNSEYVFQRHGQPFNKMFVSRAFRKACLAAEISDFRFHDLRHCFSSWNRQAGVELETISDLLGHSDIRMTLRYAHIGKEDFNKAVIKMELNYDSFMTATKNQREETS